MIAHSEAQAVIECERMRWAAEKSVSRLDSADDMRWVLRQAGDDYAAAEKFLAAWDELRPHSVALAVSVVRNMGEIQRASDPISNMPRPLTARNIVALIDKMNAVSKLDGTPLPQRRFDSTHKDLDDRIWGRFTDSLPRHTWRDTFSVIPPYVVPLRINHLILRLAMYLALEWTL
jgi:hypothetical protein